MNEDQHVTFSIDAFNAGSEMMFKKYFLEHYPSLCYLAQSILGDTSISKDMAAEALIKTWSKRGRFKSVEHLHAYSIKALQTTCLNFIRKDNRAARRNMIFSGRMEERELLTAIVESETLRLLHQAIEKLPEQCCRVIKLSYVEGWRTDDIGRYMNISANTVKAQKARGIKLLKNMLPRDMISVFL